MADERGRGDVEDEGAPKIRVVDRRMLSEDERAGKGVAPAASGGSASGDSGAPPKLEIVGGGARRRARQNEPNEAPDAPPETDRPADDAADEPLLEPEQPAPMVEPDGETAPPMRVMGTDGTDDEPLSDEEMEQVRAEMEAVEAEQFAALEQRMGRPLTEQEKDAVREEMERQAQSVASLEVAPMLQQWVAELSARAAVHMGLMPNPYTRLIAKNDAQARLAIDAFGALLEVLKPHLDPASQREYARVLNDLRVNFVSLTGVPTGGVPTGAAPTGGLRGGPGRIIH